MGGVFGGGGVFGVLWAVVLGEVVSVAGLGRGVAIGVGGEVMIAGDVRGCGGRRSVSVGVVVGVEALEEAVVVDV